MPDWDIVRLPLFKGNRRLFTSGDADLDTFLHDLAGQYERRGVGMTWIACPRNDGSRPVGYYTSAASSLPFQAVPIKLPRHPIPTILIGRLAVDVNYRGLGLGQHLLFDALRRAREVSRVTAVWGVTVDAYENAIAFYTRYGFQLIPEPPPSPDVPRTMLLPMKEINKMAL